MSAPRLFVVVPAAGRGLRFGADRPKQYLPLAGTTVLAQTLTRLATLKPAAMAIGLAPDDTHWAAIRPPLAVPVVTFAGGAERMVTVLNGLTALSAQAADDDLVFVHDAARPCVRIADLQRLYAAACESSDGALLARPVADTVKRGGPDGVVVETVDRRGLWLALTPQAFRFGQLRAALSAAIAANALVTDEAAAVERLGGRPRLVPGSADNIKITVPEDLALAALYLAEQDPRPAPRGPFMRIGQGFDAHGFVEGRPLVLGGVTIPHPYGLGGHSDADVLTHAVTSACLGAAALGDLGRHFPASDPRFKDCDSRILLRAVQSLLQERGFYVINVDATIVAEAPRLAPYVGQMAERLAADLQVAVDCVSVKATTTEGMGYTGRREGMSAHAVALIDRRG